MRLRHRLVILSFCALAGSVCLAAGKAKPSGISISPAKVFDNRSLVIMLEQLEHQLQSINVVDSEKSKMLAALGNYQGARITEVSRALSVSGPSLPKVSTTEVAGADNAGLQPSERTTDQAALTPTAPALPGQTSALSMSPSFGGQAEDVLSDQVTLSYQIMNVRMLLERALSDRLYNEKARVQVVLGFQIGIDPPKDAKDKAAFVELTVKSSDGGPLSVVSVMPYEKTYNAYAIDRRSNAFGGAAVAKVVSVGYSEQRRSETLYVYKDADTLALGNPIIGPESKEVTFGWEFRPVLGRRSVSPGLRQMFAVVALSAVDGNEVAALPPLSVEAKSCWRKYDSNKSTTSGEAEMSATNSLGTVQPLRTDVASKQLKATIADVQWRATDNNTAIVQIAGTNLFTGTQVTLGSKTYDSPATGLTFKSDHLLELRTSVNDIAFGDGALSGRYGNVVSLSSAPPEPASRTGIAINEVRFRDEPGREFIPVTVILQARDGQPLKLPSEQPLISVGAEVANSVYGESVQCIPRAVSGGSDSTPTLSRAIAVVSSSPPTAKTLVDCWRFTGMVTSTRLRGEPVVSIKYPFRGDRWQATFPISLPFAISAVTNLGTFETAKKVKVARLAITGRGFEPTWSVILDQEYKAPAVVITDTLIQLDIAAATLAGFKSLIVLPSPGHPVVLKLPDGKPAALAPAIDAGQSRTVKKETSVAVVFTGKDLNGIKAATFDGKALTKEVSDDGKKITLFLTREVTAKTGVATILLETEDGLISLTVTIES